MIVYKIKETGQAYFCRHEKVSYKLKSDERTIDADIIPENLFTYYSDSYKTIHALMLLRTKRNNLLLETDWWASSDLTMSAKQTAYRKALRDLPATASPELVSDFEITGVTWPTKPE